MLYEQVDIYLDESGDLGFTFPGSSNHLILCAMATTDSVALSRLPKKVRRKLNIKGMDTEIKFSNSNERIRKYFLNGIAESNCWIVWGAIDKHKVMEPLRKKKDKLYHYVCGMVLSDIFSRTHASNINVILDRMTAKKTNRNDFDRYIQEKLHKSHAGNFQPALTVSHLVSLNCQCLQVHDFVVGSIFQSLERDNQQYVNIISDKIVSGRKYW
jgi:hypothetical protein